VWSFRREWPAEKTRLRAELRTGTFRFGLLDRIRRESGEEVEVFASRDALVLKALALVLGEHLLVSRRCVHVKGHGGAKAAVRWVMRRLPGARFVLKTDVKIYSASIDHVKLLDRLAAAIPDRDVLNLVGQMLCRVSEGGGLCYEFRRCIPPKGRPERAHGRPRARPQVFATLRENRRLSVFARIHENGRGLTLEALRKARTIQKTPLQLDPPVRAQLLYAKDDRKITLATASNRVFPYSHGCGPFGEERLLALSSIPPKGPLSIRAFHHASLLRIRVNRTCTYRAC